MPERPTAYAKKLLDHLSKTWPNNQKQVFCWTHGRIDIEMSDFAVVRIAPSASGAPWIFVTCGVGSARSDEKLGHEFFLICLHENPINIEALAILASFYLPKTPALDVGDCLDIGRGWTATSKLGHLLISLPYPYHSKLERFIFNDPQINIR